MSARASALADPATEPAGGQRSVRPSATLERQRPSEPWSTATVSRVIAVSGVGLLVMGVGWYGASSTIVLNRQLLFLVLGIAGVTIVAVGQGMFVLDGLRELKRRRLDVMVDVLALVVEPETGVAEGERVASPQMVHFHRGDCLLVLGKDATIRGSAEEQIAAGRTACGVCDA